jgi:hypothetical protein
VDRVLQIHGGAQHREFQVQFADELGFDLIVAPQQFQALRTQLYRFDQCRDTPREAADAQEAAQIEKYGAHDSIIQRAAARTYTTLKAMASSSARWCDSIDRIVMAFPYDEPFERQNTSVAYKSNH